MSERPRALVVVFPGSNGDRDLQEALTLAGFSVSAHPCGAPLPRDVQLVGLPGGFSYGDYWRAGMLASQARAVLDLPRHVDAGGLCIGICNGFQILVESGLLPGALTHNHPFGFRHRWVEVRRTRAGDSPWFSNLAPGRTLRLPMAHGEGNYFHPDGAAALRDLVPLTYVSNPNGSMADAAALLDLTGRVLGVMPHPERAIDPALGSTDGLELFVAARRWLDGRARS